MNLETTFFGARSLAHANCQTWNEISGAVWHFASAPC